MQTYFCLGSGEAWRPTRSAVELPPTAKWNRQKGRIRTCVTLSIGEQQRIRSAPGSPARASEPSPIDPNGALAKCLVYAPYDCSVAAGPGSVSRRCACDLGLEPMAARGHFRQGSPGGPAHRIGRHVEGIVARTMTLDNHRPDPALDAALRRALCQAMSAGSLRYPAPPGRQPWSASQGEGRTGDAPLMPARPLVWLPVPSSGGLVYWS